MISNFNQGLLFWIASIRKFDFWCNTSSCVRGYLSAAWPNDSERRFYVGRDRKVDGSITTQASLLRP